jgi:hypothetical protein
MFNVGAPATFTVTVPDAVPVVAGAGVGVVPVAGGVVVLEPA